MRLLRLAVGLACAGVAVGQAHRFSWQEYCFTNPSAIVCPGHEYFKKGPKGAGSAGVSVVIAPEGIDWRFADPASDVLVGFHGSDLVASPLARRLIIELGAKQGLSEADGAKILDALSGIDEGALSARNHIIVAMLIGRADGWTIAPGAGMKAIPVSEKAALVGHGDAVDHAVQRFGTMDAPDDAMRVAEERQDHSNFWISGSGELLGPEALEAGVRRFSLTVTARDRLTSELAVEFHEAPSAEALRKWLPTLGAVLIDSNTVHLHIPVDQVIAGPLGKHLAELVEAARYLPIPGAATTVTGKAATR